MMWTEIWKHLNANGNEQTLTSSPSLPGDC
jgi:hypothetical protein